MSCPRDQEGFMKCTGVLATNHEMQVRTFKVGEMISHDSYRKTKDPEVEGSRSYQSNSARCPVSSGALKLPSEFVP